MIRFKVKRYEYGAHVHTELYEFKTGVFFVFVDGDLLGFQMLISEAKLNDAIEFGINIAKFMDINNKIKDGELVGNLNYYQTVSCEFVDNNGMLVKYTDINGVLIFLDSNNCLNVYYYLKDGKLMDDVIKHLDKVCGQLYGLIFKNLINKKEI